MRRHCRCRRTTWSLTVRIAHFHSVLLHLLLGSTPLIAIPLRDHCSRERVRRPRKDGCLSKDPPPHLVLNWKSAGWKPRGFGFVA